MPLLGVNPEAAPFINRFHALVHGLQLRHNEQAWNSGEANWFPPHVLPFRLDPLGLGRFVCTQATDHRPPRGLILYDVRQPDDDERRRKRQRLAVDFELWGFEDGFAEVLPMIRAELPNAIRFYDPEIPNYVIIVPQEFYWEWYKHKNDRMLERMPGVKVRPAFLDPRHPVGQFHIIAGTTTLIAAAAIGGWAVVAAVANLTAASAASAATIAGASAGGGAAAGGGTVISLAAYRALLALPAAKTLAAAAGVLLIIGTIKDAQAANPSIGQVSAIRAAAVADFRPAGSTQVATSAGPPKDFRHTPETAKGKFGLGTRVLFDDKPHFIIGQISAK
jgi:hypothetical protein